MKDAAACNYANFIQCIGSCTKTFPIYKQCMTKCQIIPEKSLPSKCFRIKSYQVAVKSQQLGLVGSRKNCCNSCRVLHPSQGFQLVEYADKSCSEQPKKKQQQQKEEEKEEDEPVDAVKEEEEPKEEVEDEIEEKPLPPPPEPKTDEEKKEEKPKTVTKSTATEDAKVADKAITCDLIKPQVHQPQMQSASVKPLNLQPKPQSQNLNTTKSQTPPPVAAASAPAAVPASAKEVTRRPCKPCLKNSSCLVDKKCSSSSDRNPSCKEIVLCKKCKEKRRKNLQNKCQCRSTSGSVIYYKKNCNCAKERERGGGEGEGEGGDCIEDGCTKLECNKYKCRYLDLIQRIKCMFGREN